MAGISSMMAVGQSGEVERMAPGITMARGALVRDTDEGNIKRRTGQADPSAGFTASS
jgi:hypothetical protein